MNPDDSYLPLRPDKDLMIPDIKRPGFHTRFKFFRTIDRHPELIIVTGHTVRSA